MGVERRVIAGALAVASFLPGSSGPAENPPGYTQAQQGILSPAITTVEEQKFHKQRNKYPSYSEHAAEQINVTVEGYRNFVKNINRSFMNEAQRLGAFNLDLPIVPSFLRLHVEPVEEIVNHYTTKYYNFGTETNKPDGPFSAHHMIASMNARDGVGCCGVHAAVDRNGIGYQFVPWNKRVKHAIPVSNRSVGIEVEAGSQGGIDTQQYDGLIYYDTYLEIELGLAEKKPLDESLKGHSELGKGSPDFPKVIMATIVRPNVRKLLHELGYKKV